MSNAKIQAHPIHGYLNLLIKGEKLYQMKGIFVLNNSFFGEGRWAGNDLRLHCYRTVIDIQFD